MNVKELKQFLEDYPDDMEVKIRPGGDSIQDLIPDHVLHTSETVFVDTEAPEDEWDCETGKVRLGDGKQYLLFNPIIV